jgi:hypothetical protein
VPRAPCARIPPLAGHEIVVVLVGDGHTRLPLTEVPGFRRYPLRLYHYADDLFVRAIAGEHSAAAGARLLAIDRGHARSASRRWRPSR